ncbi:hypothetical protein DFH28DRAFT_34884 [Melampsora americana]|nr:hypothetical protein DFH28DRAFT_34884 [Melampsora americana]
MMLGVSFSSRQMKGLVVASITLMSATPNSMSTPLQESQGLFRRKMGQEHTIEHILVGIKGCPGEVCGKLAGGISGALLAGAPACAAQKLADTLINEAKNNPLIKDQKMKDEIIAFAKVLCAAEKNTPPDYKNPPHTPLSAVYCLEPPKNPELIGLYTTQDAGNNASAFFDPVNKTTILAGAPGTVKPSNAVSLDTKSNSTASTKTLITTTESTTETNKNATAKIDVSDLPKCSNPTIVYAAGQEGRSKTEFTYAPANTENFKQGVALKISIVTQAICDIILKCVREAGKGKDDDSKGTVKKCRALQAKIGEAKGDGSAADKWNEAVCSNPFLSLSFMIFS